MTGVRKDILFTIRNIISVFIILAVNSSL